MHQVDFYFDFISPYSYLAVIQIPELAKKHDVAFNWIPVNLPKLIQLSGNVPPSLIKNKAIYSLKDLKRWAAYLDVPFKMIRPGSFDSRPALAIAAALQDGERERFCLGVFHAVWSGDIDPRQEAWLEKVFRAQGFPQGWLKYADAHAPILMENTQVALKAGAFGVPLFVLHGQARPELFFGVDHLHFLERACAKA